MLMRLILLAAVADSQPVALRLFRDPIFNLALLLIGLMAIALAAFWLLEVFRATAWRLHERAGENGLETGGDGPPGGVRIEEPDTDLRRRFFHRVRLLPRMLSEGRMNDPPWRS